MANVPVLECFLAKPLMGQSLSVPDVEMHSGLASPICVPSFWESTSINVSMGGSNVKSSKALQKLLKPSLILLKSNFSSTLPQPRFGCKAFMLLLSFLSFASPCLLTFALWSIKLQDGKGDNLISSSVYSRKLPCSTLCLECIKCIPLSGFYPKGRQGQPCSSGQRPEHTYHLEAFVSITHAQASTLEVLSQQFCRAFWTCVFIFKMLPR